MELEDLEKGVDRLRQAPVRTAGLLVLLLLVLACVTYITSYVGKRAEQVAEGNGTQGGAAESADSTSEEEGARVSRDNETLGEKEVSLEYMTAPVYLADLIDEHIEKELFLSDITTEGLEQLGFIYYHEASSYWREAPKIVEFVGRRCCAFLPESGLWSVDIDCKLGKCTLEKVVLGIVLDDLLYRDDVLSKIHERLADLERDSCGLWGKYTFRGRYFALRATVLGAFDAGCQSKGYSFCWEREKKKIGSTVIQYEFYNETSSAKARLKRKRDEEDAKKSGQQLEL